MSCCVDLLVRWHARSVPWPCPLVDSFDDVVAEDDADEAGRRPRIEPRDLRPWLRGGRSGSTRLTVRPAPLRHGQAIRPSASSLAAASGARHGRRRRGRDRAARAGRRRLARDGLGRGRERAVEALPRLLGAEDEPGRAALPRGTAARAGARRFWRALRSQRRRHGFARACRHRAEGHRPRGAARLSRRSSCATASRLPVPGGLSLAPHPARLAALPYFELHPLGLEQRRSVTLIRAAATGRPGSRRAWRCLARPRLAPACGRSPAWAPGRPPRRRARRFGDPDAVSLGDFHTPNLVAWALAGEPRATTHACSSSSSRTAASAPASCGCSSCRACGRQASGRVDRSARSWACTVDVPLGPRRSVPAGLDKL